MPTMPDWPSLWEREPGMRPAGLTFHPRKGEPAWDGVRNKPREPLEIVYTEAHYTHEECESCSWDMNYDGNGDASPELAAALCRDAAVRWLSAETAIHIVGPRVFVNWSARDYHPDRVMLDDVPYVRFSADTLDAALFAACAAVLDARGAALKTRQS